MLQTRIVYSGSVRLRQGGFSLKGEQYRLGKALHQIFLAMF